MHRYYFFATFNAMSGKRDWYVRPIIVVKSDSVASEREKRRHHHDDGDRWSLVRQCVTQINCLVAAGFKLF